MALHNMGCSAAAASVPLSILASTGVRAVEEHFHSLFPGDGWLWQTEAREDKKVNDFFMRRVATSLS